VTKTGPQIYPGASTRYWFQSKYPGDSMESNVVVWHSTEGTSVPGYDGGSMAPNLTAMPDFKAKKLVWYQHFDFDVSARALVHAGAVATNTLNVCQIEVVGTCDPSTHEKWTKQGVQHLYMADLPDWVIRDLGAFAKWAHDKQGVPLTSGVTFKAYPAAYGTSNGVRMSNAAWLKFQGHCGHQHVPSGNVHGDPGAFPMTAVLKAATGSSTTPEEDPLAGMTKADIYDAVWKTDSVAAPADAPDYATNKNWQPQSYLKDTNVRVRNLEKTLTAVQAANTKLVDTVALLASNVAGLDPAAIVTELRDAIEAISVHLDVSGN
jgi:hypothetical protein